MLRRFYSPNRLKIIFHFFGEFRPYIGRLADRFDIDRFETIFPNWLRHNGSIGNWLELLYLRAVQCQENLCGKKYNVSFDFLIFLFLENQIFS